jgi:hypothetical protein
MTTIQPELCVDAGVSAVSFYEDAFGARLLHMVGDGEDVVAQLAIGEAVFWVATAGASTGKSSMEAMRCLKRRLSDLVYKTMLDDAIPPDTRPKTGTGPGGQRGNDSDSSATGSQPQHRHFGQATPGPVADHPKPVLPNVS